jgi:hypothetical protein
MQTFVKLTVVYPDNPHRPSQQPTDMRMRDTFVRPEDILEITPTIPEDGSVVAKTHVRLSWAPGPLTVLETADEVFELLKKAEVV